ncbi:hypothetical protein KEM55_009361, partial [Ascosphaera atra]
MSEPNPVAEPAQLEPAARSAPAAQPAVSPHRSAPPPPPSYQQSQPMSDIRSPSVSAFQAVTNSYTALRNAVAARHALRPCTPANLNSRSVSITSAATSSTIAVASKTDSSTTANVSDGDCCGGGAGGDNGNCQVPMAAPNGNANGSREQDGNEESRPRTVAVVWEDGSRHSSMITEPGCEKDDSRSGSDSKGSSEYSSATNPSETDQQRSEAVAAAAAATTETLVSGSGVS